MGGIDRPADVQVDVGSLFKEHPCGQGGAVLLIAPLAVPGVVPQVVHGVLHHPAQGDHALGDQVHTLQLGGGGNLRVHVGGKSGVQLTAQMPCGQGGGGAAGHDMPARLSEKGGEHALLIVRVPGGAQHQADGLTLPEPYRAHRGVVSGPLAVEPLALSGQDGGHGLGGGVGVVHGLQKLADGPPVPGQVQHRPHTGVEGPVAEGYKGVVLPEVKAGLIDLLAVNLHHVLGIGVGVAVPQENDMGVVKLDDLGGFAALKAQNGEGGVGHLPLGTHRQGGGDGIHAVGQGQAVGHHGGDDFGRQGGQDAGLHAGAQPVGQHHHQTAVLAVHNLHVVTAQLLTEFIQAHIAHIGNQFTHGPGSPSAW